jgi:uncharacterized YccA/Bax inhibitor family protein|tara:strand:+ start:266 stop:520 length:255 start_codon:yes stop_codon:yes gene_type:complete
MAKIKKLGFIVLGLASLYLAYITGTGDILNYINFTDPLGEMMFCILFIIMSVFSIISAFSKDEVEIPCSLEQDMEWANESENIQ